MCFRCFQLLCFEFSLAALCYPVWCSLCIHIVLKSVQTICSHSQQKMMTQWLLCNYDGFGTICILHQIAFLRLLHEKRLERKGTQNTEQQFSSVAQSCLTLCDPMNHSTPGLPVRHQLPEFTQTHVHRISDAIQPSHPLSSPSPPAPNPSHHQSLF